MDEALSSLTPDQDEQQQILDSLPNEQREAINQQIEAYRQLYEHQLPKSADYDVSKSFTVRKAGPESVELVYPDETAFMVNVDGSSWQSIGVAGLHYHGPDDHGGFYPE